MADEPTIGREAAPPSSAAKARHPDKYPTRRAKLSDWLTLLPKQKDFLAACKNYIYVLYGGARGGGKSHILRWALLIYLLQHAKSHPGLRVALFCETYPVLKDRQIVKVKREFPKELGKYVESDKVFRLKEQYGGGELAFRNLDEPEDYLGVEFAAMGIDQIELHHVQVFDDLRGSLRWPGIEKPLFICAANPGGIGHLWVKAYWLDAVYPPELEPYKHQFKFVRSLPTDNPHLTDAYWSYLKSQPMRRQRAWIHGDWTVFEGQVFQEWRDDLHVINKPWGLPATWRIAGAMDWGSRRPGSIGLYASGPDGDIVRFWEFYFSEMDAYTVGFTAGIKMRNLPTFKIEWIAADPQMWEGDALGGPNIAEEVQRGLRDSLRDNAPVLIEAPKGPGSRAVGRELVHEALAWQEDENEIVKPWMRPKLRFVKAKCPHAVRTIPALPYAKTGDLEDVDTKAEDHCYDELRYYLQARVPRPDSEDDELPQDRHPGYGPNGRRPRHQTDEMKEVEAWDNYYRELERLGATTDDFSRFSPTPRGYKWNQPGVEVDNPNDY